MTERAKKLLLLYYKQSRKIRRVSGLPPLTFKAKKAGTLKNYRIYGNTETKTRSYSGSAPLSFPITGGAVSNYRVYGNTVNGESVGELVTDSQSEHYGKYAIPITNNSETTNIYLDAPLRKVGDEAEYVDYATQKQHRVRKNLLQNTATSQTIQGVTFTVNSDGSVTCNGTVTSSTAILVELCSPGIELPQNTPYIITGCPSGGTITNGYKIQYYDGTSWKYEIGNGATFTVSNSNLVRLRILISPGVGVENLTFYPMIRKADIEDDTYEPYIENTEVDVTIPDLPAQSSTNSLSFGTTIQPSSVAVDVDEVVSCGDKVTDSQSVNYGKYKIPVTLTADSAETTDIYLDEPLRKVGDEAEYVDYATQKWHRVRKNLLQNTRSSQTKNGVTFTVNMDGSVTSNGQASGVAIFQIPIQLATGMFIINGCPKNGDAATYSVDLRNPSNGYVIGGRDAGEGFLFTAATDTTANYSIRIEPGYTCDNLTFYPMIRKADIEDDTYEPYIENTEVDVTLPVISTLAGTNTLTVGTEVQPSSVEIKGRIKAAGGD